MFATGAERRVQLAQKAMAAWRLDPAGDDDDIETHGEADSYRQVPEEESARVGYRYQDAAGMKHEGKLRLRSADPPLRVGDPISVLYDPQAPSEHSVLRHMFDVMVVDTRS